MLCYCHAEVNSTIKFGSRAAIARRLKPCIMRSSSLGVAEVGNLKLHFTAKTHWNSFFWFEYIFRCYRDTKTTKTLSAV